MLKIKHMFKTWHSHLNKPWILLRTAQLKLSEESTTLQTDGAQPLPWSKYPCFEVSLCL